MNALSSAFCPMCLGILPPNDAFVTRTLKEGLPEPASSVDGCIVVPTGGEGFDISLECCGKY